MTGRDGRAVVSLRAIASERDASDRLELKPLPADARLEHQPALGLDEYNDALLEGGGLGGVRLQGNPGGICRQRVLPAGEAVERGVVLEDDQLVVGLPAGLEADRGL